MESRGYNSAHAGFPDYRSTIKCLDQGSLTRLEFYRREMRFHFK